MSSYELVNSSDGGICINEINGDDERQIETQIFLRSYPSKYDETKEVLDDEWVCDLGRIPHPKVIEYSISMEKYVSDKLVDEHIEFTTKRKLKAKRVLRRIAMKEISDLMKKSETEYYTDFTVSPVRSVYAPLDHGE